MKVLRIRLALSVAVLLTLGSEQRAEADLTVYVEAPGAQTSQVTGTGVTLTTENFNGFSPGNYSSLSTAVGTINSMNGEVAIVPADIYGGGGGTGNYFAVGAQSGSAAPATLMTLNGPQGYFGFWWSAADRFNQVSFFNSANQLLGSFNTPFVLAAVDALPNGSQYFGNPNNGGDSGEPFVYLNFVATNGQSISSIVFANSGNSGTGFESDNWTISAVAPTGNLGTLIAGGITVVPEPSSLSVVVGMCALCGLACLLGRRRRERSRGLAVCA